MADVGHRDHDHRLRGRIQAQLPRIRDGLGTALGAQEVPVDRDDALGDQALDPGRGRWAVGDDVTDPQQADRNLSLEQQGAATQGGHGVARDDVPVEAETDRHQGEQRHGCEHHEADQQAAPDREGRLVGGGDDLHL